MDKINEEAKFFERLDISVLSINKIKNIIKNYIKNNLKCLKNGNDLEKLAYHIVGPAGIGKTEICKQIAKELSKELEVEFQCIIIKAPVISRDDLLCPFPEINNGSTKFKMLYSDFIPTDKSSYGLFVIDEFSRGDHTLQQLCSQILNENKVHIYDFPRGFFVISTDNPDDSEYAGMNFLDDAALTRRSLHLYTEVSVPDFLSFAISDNFHPFVIEFIQSHPDYLYDFISQKVGRVFANPASYQKVSNILNGYETDQEIFKNMDDINVQCSGLLNTTMTRLFLDFMKNKDNDIRPKDIVFNYKDERKKVKNLIKDSNNTKIGQLMQSFLTYLSTSKPSITSKELDNISTFLLDIPSDIGATYFTMVQGIKSRDQDAFLYLTKIQMDLMKNDEYRTKFYEAMVDMSKRSRS
jgi:hypothetical protein